MNLKSVIKLITLSASCVGIISCSSNYAVSTNLDKDNINQYFSASKVTIYEKETNIPGPYKFIEGVEGQDCQQRPHHAAPDEINARTQARQQAFSLGANAIVFSGCAQLTPEKLAELNQSNDAKQCHALVICYGRSFYSGAEQ